MGQGLGSYAINGFQEHKPSWDHKLWKLENYLWTCLEHQEEHS